VSKQLLMYGKVEPVNKQRHAEWSIKAGDDFEFARDLNSVPLTAIEFPNAAEEYAVVFTENDGAVMPVVIMGVREAENLYLDSEGVWQAKYVPAFVRRYPFVFSSADSGETLTLCLDEEFAGCNQDGRGERLFDADGEQTAYLQSVLEFLKDYQAHYRRTQQFCAKLKELDILEPMGAQYRTPDGERGSLSGFMAVNRDKLKALTGEQLEALIKTDELELIYLHLQSMRNFGAMVSRISGETAEETEGTEA